MKVVITNACQETPGTTLQVKPFTRLLRNTGFYDQNQVTKITEQRSLMNEAGRLRKK